MSTPLLYIIVEGSTERLFCERVLQPHLSPGTIVMAVEVATRRSRKGVQRGGFVSFEKLMNDLNNTIKQKSKPYVTTMVDCYAFPTKTPGYEEAMQQKHPYDKVATLERSIETALIKALTHRGMNQDTAEHIVSTRFIPYIQLHEYESLLLCDLSRLEPKVPDNIQRKNTIEALKALQREVDEQFDTPEHVDHGPETHPAKRIINAFSGYKNQKAGMGSEVAQDIGLPLLRERCRHFDVWLLKLEGIQACG